jgi:multiple sugar transport system substrate-binding protein
VVGLSESLPGRIFISYRRQETAWPARQLYDVLVEHFPAEEVFKDVDNIDPGDEFVERITAAVKSCDVLLALIGPTWLTITNKRGQRRLDDPEDYVRLEIETALTRKIRVIPILVDEAQMPGADELPATLAPLVRRNAVEINPVTFDTKRLLSTVQKTLVELKVSDTSTESPISTAGPEGSKQQVVGAEVGRLYDAALAAFWAERWDEAVDLLGQVVSRQPGYGDASGRLEVARRQRELALHYSRAAAAADVGDWEQAVAGYTMIVDADPGYRDASARLAHASQQRQRAILVAEAYRLHRAGQWAAVINLGEQLQAIDPAAADPEGLITSARAELAAEQRAAELTADYQAGLRLFAAGRWKEAVGILERVTQLDPAYQDASALLGQAAAALAEEEARLEAERRRRVLLLPPGMFRGEVGRLTTPNWLETPIVRRGKDSASPRRTLIVIGLAIAAVLITMVVVRIHTIGSGSSSTSVAAADFSKQGDIEVWQDKDGSGDFKKLVDKFNAQHPNGKVTVHELRSGADQQHQQMMQNTKIKNPKMAVMSVDVVLTAEFAAKGYVVALPSDQFPTTDFLPAAVESATYLGKLYAYPSTFGGGLLYYRKDLLDKYGLKPPITFDEMKADCDKIQAGENDPKLGCFAGQYRKYEGLTVTFDEAVHGAGGVIVGDDGKPNVATPEAIKGLSTLVDWFKDGYIPKDAITWGADKSRQAFQAGQLIFHRNWSWAYSLAQKNNGSSAIVGKFDVAPLPGITGPGVSSLGGRNYVIAKNADNKGTAMDFLRFMSSPEAQKSNNLAINTPALASLYNDPDIVKKFPYMPTLLKSIQTAKPRPKAVNYGDVTMAIQDAAYPALQGQVQPDVALQALQTKLQTLIK